MITDQAGFDIHIARFGGDEFVVFLGNAGSGTVAQKVAARLVRVLSEPFQLDAHTARIGASVGCAFAPQHGANFPELLKAADTAMYHAKNTGRNRYEFYHPKLDVEMQKVTEQEQELRAAIACGQLELHFQPLYDARSMRICSAEALARWNHPSRGLLLPASFMPIVERCRLTEQLGEWVLNEATRRIAHLSSNGTPLLVAVNISPLHIEHVDFATLVRSCLRRWKTPASLLQIEVTEDAAMSNADAASDQLRQLHELGVSTAIDDVGTGYSNLASLINLPLSRLKIDRSLITNLCSSPDSRVLVQTIISMANSLGLHSVVEGVETQEQLELVTEMGCDIIQGFLLSKVLTFDELEAVLIREPAPPFVNPHLKMAS
jgi:predicted signal transduction protein with EAL and GGDEF domain